MPLRRTFIGVLALSWVLAAHPHVFAQEAAAATSGSYPGRDGNVPAERENRRHGRSEYGINNTRRATLSDGRITHDAHIQTVDISKTVFQPARGPAELNFKDTYRYNIAAYRLARLLGLNHVPVSVERRLGRDLAAVTWWVDDVLMDEGAQFKRACPRN